MKILLFNQDWFAEEFQAAGHEVMSCGFSSHLYSEGLAPFQDIEEIISRLPGGFDPDVVIFHDNSSPFMITGLQKTKRPVVFYSVDAHHHHALHRYLAHLVDYTFVAQRDYIPNFEKLGATVEWMPLWASRMAGPSIEKKYGAVFVGTLDPNLNPDRVAFFEALKRKADILCITGGWQEIFPKSEIVINQTVKGDLNFRVFEAMGSGVMLLTERAPNGLLDLFQDGKHLVCYQKGDVDQAAELIQKYLGNLSLCREIAAAGHEEIKTRHMACHRAARFLEIAGTLKKQKAVMRCFGASRNFAHLALLFEKRKDKGMAVRALQEALMTAEEGLRGGEQMTNDLACHVAISATLFDTILASNVGVKLLNSLGDAYLDFPILRLGEIRLLLNSGKNEEARAIAEKSFTQPAEEVFKSAEEVIRSMMNQVC